MTPRSGDSERVDASHIQLALDGEEVDGESIGLLAVDVLVARRSVGAFSLVFTDALATDQLRQVQRVIIACPGQREPGERSGSTSRILLSGEVHAVRQERDTIGGSALVLRGFDLGGRLLYSRRTRTWHDMDANAVASTLAREHGIKFESRSGESADREWSGSRDGDGLAVTDGLVIERHGEPMVPWMQSNESDWAFLRRLALKNELELQVRGEELFFGKQDTTRNVVEAEAGESGKLSFLRADENGAELVLHGTSALVPGERVLLPAYGPRQGGIRRVEETRFLLDGAGWTSIILAETERGAHRQPS